MLLAFATGTSFILAGCSGNDESVVAAEAAPLPAVTVAGALKAEIQQRVSVTGTLLPRDEILVFPESAGYAINELLVDVGDRVQAGDVLARVDSRALEAQLAQSQAEQAQARAGVQQARGDIASAEAKRTQSVQALDRIRQLRTSGTATQASLDEALANDLTSGAAIQSAQAGLAVAEAQFQRADANLGLARLNLANAELRAPVGGIVSARQGQVGSIASATGDPVFKIIRDGLVEAEAEVIETELGRLEQGDPVTLDIAGVGKVLGSVRQIRPVLDPGSRIGTIRIALDERASLRPGLFAGGWVVSEKRDGLTVPVAAVITDAEGSYVLKVENGVIGRHPVNAGLIWQDRREIVSGLNAGDDVVARAGAFFTDGDRIQPVRSDAVASTGTGTQPDATR